MSQDVKQEQQTPEQLKEAITSDFQVRVKDFLTKFEALQKESKVGIRPIITQTGPDFQFIDVKVVEEEQKAQETVAKV